MVTWLVGVIGVAQAERSSWTDYAQAVAATAAVMPVTYAVGEALTGTSNQLLSGMLPAVISGVVLPSAVAVGTSSIVADKRGVSLDTGTVFGQTVGLNVGLYAGGTAMGVSTDEIKDRLLFGAVSALLLPIPSMVAMKSPGTTAHLYVAPTETEGWTMSASVQHRF